MSKSKRLIDLMMVVNRKRQFTVKELADEFQVSTRTMLRDLQELSELGVPLYSEVGPHGGYKVLNARVLPPISFSEDEATAIFFAIHALRHYVYLPFEIEFSSALNKFYYFMPDDVRSRIDEMKNRVDFEAPRRQVESPHLSFLLNAAIHQEVIRIEHKSHKGMSSREIQPIGIFARNGLWYCPAYCFTRRDIRTFRCDRIVSVASVTTVPLNLQHIHLENRRAFHSIEKAYTNYYVELTKEGVQRCEAESWLESNLHVRENGTGSLEGPMPEDDIPFFAQFLISLGTEATVRNPPELIDKMRQTLAEIMNKYTE